MILSIYFSYSTGLKLNLSKCEITCIGGLKGVHVAICHMCCVDLSNNTFNTLGTHFSYNEKLKEENFYTTAINIQRVLKNMENEKSYTREENCYF